jgi:hypothetical protein
MFNSVAIVLKPRDGGTVLRKHIFDQIAIVNRQVMNTAVNYLGRQWGFTDVCKKSLRSCNKDSLRPANDCIVLPMSFNNLVAKMDDIEQKRVNITWPYFSLNSDGDDFLDHVEFAPGTVSYMNT